MIEGPEEKVAKILATSAEVPSFPEVVQNVVRLAGGEARDLAEWIGRDQGLTARALRVVNSAFYSLSQPICSLDHAVSLLGTSTIKSMALSLSVAGGSPTSVCPDFDRKQFWRHSLTTALGARSLSALALPGQDNMLYVAGLLHDIGVHLLVSRLPDDYARVLHLFGRAGGGLVEIERQVFGISHCEVGRTLAEKWRLPPTISQCLLYHEDPSAVGPEQDEHLRKAIQIVALADRWSATRGLGFPGESGTSAGCDIPAELHLSREQVDENLSALAEEVGRREEQVFAGDRPTSSSRSFAVESG